MEASDEPPPQAIPGVSDAQRKRIKQQTLEWLETKWPDPKTCPVCRTTNWAIGDLAEVSLFQGGGLLVGGLRYLFVPVSCTNCSNTFFFNAIQMGIEPDESGQ